MPPPEGLPLPPLELLLLLLLELLLPLLLGLLLLLLVLLELLLLLLLLELLLLPLLLEFYCSCCCCWLELLLLLLLLELLLLPLLLELMLLMLLLLLLLLRRRSLPRRLVAAWLLRRLAPLLSLTGGWVGLAPPSEGGAPRQRRARTQQSHSAVLRSMHAPPAERPRRLFASHAGPPSPRIPCAPRQPRTASACHPGCCSGDPSSSCGPAAPATSTRQPVAETTATLHEPPPPPRPAERLRFWGDCRRRSGETSLRRRRPGAAHGDWASAQYSKSLRALLHAGRPVVALH